MSTKKGTIFQRLETKIDNMERRAIKKAEQKVRHERIIEMARSMNLLEKIQLIIKIL